VTPAATRTCSPTTPCSTARRAATPDRRRCWAAEGPATLHLTLNPVVDPGDSPDEAVVHSILLIVEPTQPVTIRTAAAITQTVRRRGGTWRISRRSVAPASPPS
jgi:hypothetical protein